MRNKIRKPNGYWTKERCLEDARLYNNRTEWEEKSNSAYVIAKRNKWDEECFTHMKRLIEKRGTLTKEFCYKKAILCSSRGEFQEKYPSEEQTARINGWLVDICSHMEYIILPKGTWTKEHCQEVALKCKTKKEFKSKYLSAHDTAQQNGWTKEICSHMEHLGNRYSRGIYVFEHPDNSVYIGLTYNYKERYSSHMRKNKVLIEKKALGGQIYRELGVFYPKDIAAVKEDELIEEYRANGWIILNKRKGGGLGGNILYWTFERCFEDAQNYKTRGEWQNKSVSAFNSARKNGWLDQCYAHMSISLTGKKKIQCIETGEIFESGCEAARKMGINQSKISAVITGKQKSTHGYTFKCI